MSQNPRCEDTSKSKPSQSKEARRVLGGLTGGFVGRFCGEFLGMAGGYRGGRAPADFMFSAGGFLADFPADCSFVFCDHKYAPQKSTEKSTTSTVAFGKISTVG